MAVKKRPKVSFEDGMTELSQMVERMQAGDMTLDAMMQTYEQGMALAGRLEEILNEHRKKIEQIDPDTAEITTFERDENGVH